MQKTSSDKYSRRQMAQPGAARRTATKRCLAIMPPTSLGMKNVTDRGIVFERWWSEEAVEVCICIFLAPFVTKEQIYLRDYFYLRYSWIGHGLQSGPTLAFSLWLSDFKTKTSFGFLIKKNQGLFFCFLEKAKK